MTEAEWLACADPTVMLEFLGRKASDRKLRLFAVACCRRLPFGKSEQFHQALETADQFAESLATKAALKRARQGVRQARYALPPNEPQVRGDWCVYWLAEVAAAENAFPSVAREIQRLATEGILELSYDVLPSLCAFLRDLFGNQLRPATLDPAILHWNDATVSKLGQAIYDDRAFDRIPILADALEEAGCTDADILDHCRQPGEHVRGCWVVDLLLGKE